MKREVYGILGVPIDALDMRAVLGQIETAVIGTAPFLFSTANLNFLVTSRSDPQFRELLLVSDLCTADGTPIVLMARLLGAPLQERIAGADVFEALKNTSAPAPGLKVFLFGGERGAAAAACENINAQSGGMVCVGSYDPGFCTVEEMSSDAILETINSSGANFFAAALGAKKGQAWLLRNHDRLQIPVRVHLGATINFQAGTIKRASARIGRWGLEWLWRIKEEPRLWRRYWNDGLVLLELVVTQLVPILILTRWQRFVDRRNPTDLRVKWTESHNSVILSIEGVATAAGIEHAIAGFQRAIAGAKDVVINFANTGLIDARFLGLLLMLNKTLKRQRRHLTFTGVSPRLERLFRLHGFAFLLGTKA